MKKVVPALGLFLLGSLLGVGICAAAPAGAKKETKNEAKKESKQTAKYVGEVTEILLDKNKLLLAKPKSSLAVVLNTSRAKFGPGYSKLEEVKVGDPVEVTAETKVGTMYALTVAKGKKEAAGEPKKEKQKLEKPKNHP